MNDTPLHEKANSPISQKGGSDRTVLAGMVVCILGAGLIGWLIKSRMGDAPDTDDAVALGMFGLRPPVKLVEADYYQDGGTMSFVIDDADGKKLTFCIDGAKTAPTQGHVFTGSKLARKPAAKEVVPGSEEEKALVRILKKTRPSGDAAKLAQRAIEYLERPLSERFHKDSDGD